MASSRTSPRPCSRARRDVRLDEELDHGVGRSGGFGEEREAKDITLNGLPAHDEAPERDGDGPAILQHGPKRVAQRQSDLRSDERPMNAKRAAGVDEQRGACRAVLPTAPRSSARRSCTCARAPCGCRRTSYTPGNATRMRTRTCPRAAARRRPPRRSCHRASRRHPAVRGEDGGGDPMSTRQTGIPRHAVAWASTFRSEARPGLQSPGDSRAVA